jgi:hypothetical protein
VSTTGPRRLCVALILTAAWATAVGPGPAEAKRGCGFVATGGGGAAEIIGVQRVTCRTARQIVRAFLASRRQIRGYRCHFAGPPEIGRCDNGHRHIRFLAD